MLTVFGSINVDQVIRVASIPVPGETTMGERVTDAFGGKGANQAVAAARASSGRVSVKMIGAIGKDAYGQSVLENFAKNNVKAACFESKSPTGTAIITVSDDGENAITVVSGANAELNCQHAAQEALKETSTLVCQGEIGLCETVAVIEQFKELRPDGIVILNLAPVPKDLSLELLKRTLNGCDILIVNELEASDLLGLLRSSSVTDLSQLTQKFNLRILITKGPDGAELFGPDQTSIQVSSPKIEPVDTTGAGDTFCGVFSMLLAEGMQFPDAMQAGCTAAAQACCSFGAQSGMPHRNEILNAKEAR